MGSSIRLLSNYEYKKRFLPNIPDKVLRDDSKIQIYRLENYLRDIIIPVMPYRITFNFLVFVRKGKMIQLIEDAKVEIRENEVLNVKQGNITATLEISSDIEGYFIAYENEIITDILIGRHDFVFFYSSVQVAIEQNVSDWLVRLFGLLEEEFLSGNSSVDVCLSIFQGILLKIIRTEKSTTKEMTRQLDISFKFRELVHQYHIEHKNVSFYARKLYISENYLNKSLKEVTSKPPKQWINEISILHSQILLQDTSRNIAGIAFELNYQSPSYFTRLFKKITGFSPKEFRKQKLQGIS